MECASVSAVFSRRRSNFQPLRRGCLNLQSKPTDNIFKDGITFVAWNPLNILTKNNSNKFYEPHSWNVIQSTHASTDAYLILITSIGARMVRVRKLETAPAIRSYKYPTGSLKQQISYDTGPRNKRRDCPSPYLGLCRRGWNHYMLLSMREGKPVSPGWMSISNF